MRRRSMRPFLLMAALALIVGACGGAGSSGVTTTSFVTSAPSEPAIPDDAVVVQLDLVGGCFMMGPNCVRHLVYGDGTVETYRLGTEPAELLGEGAIDAMLISELWQTVTDTDMDALRSELAAGRCQACVDGIDIELALTVAGQTTRFSSADVDFDEQQPVFALVGLILRAADGLVDVLIVTR